MENKPGKKGLKRKLFMYVFPLFFCFFHIKLLLFIFFLILKELYLRLSIGFFYNLFTCPFVCLIQIF